MFGNCVGWGGGMSISQDRPVTWASEKDRRQDMRRRRILDIKRAIDSWFHGAFWKTLHFTRLARPYSVSMCRLRLYRRFPDGRCQWCSVIHGK